MKRKLSWWLAGLAVAGSLAMGGCVVARPRAHVAVVAPARVWVPAHRNRGGAWIAGYWRYP